MSQRLIQPGLSAAAGSIIGYRKNGFPIRLAAGGSGEGEDGGEGGTGEDEGGGDDDSDEDDDDADKTKKDKKDKDDDEDDEEPLVPERKLNKALDRMKAADRRAAAAEAKLEELKDSAKIPDEVKKELAEIKAAMAEKDEAIEKLTKARNGSTVKLAALTVKGAPKFVNIEAALKLTDLEDVDVEDDGKVDVRALKAALKKTALDHPYLVEKAEEKKDDAGAGAGGTGSTMNKRTGKPQTADRATLATRFPVLNQR